MEGKWPKKLGKTDVKLSFSYGSINLMPGNRSNSILALRHASQVCFAKNPPYFGEEELGAWVSSTPPSHQDHRGSAVTDLLSAFDALCD